MTTAAPATPNSLDELVAGLPPEVQRTIATGRVFQALGNDPKKRGPLLRMLKDAYPDVSIPELDLQDQMDARVKEAVKPHEETATKLREDIEALRLENERERTRRRLGLDEAELVEVETLAKEGKIGDVDTAHEHWRMKHALGTPRPSRDPGAEEFQTKLRKINPRNHAALKQAAMTEGARILRESRGGGLRRVS